MSEYIYNADPFTVWTNNVPRALLDWHELTDRERAEFDYIEDSDDPDADGIARFIRYKGVVYDIYEFLTTESFPKDHPIRQWDGYQSDSYCSGIVVRFVNDSGKPADHVVMATFCI